MTRARVDGVLAAATHARVAIAACSVYTLEQAAGVIDGAAARSAPVILQVHPAGVGDLLTGLLAGLRRLADDAPCPVAVQLDHADDTAAIECAMSLGVDGVMVDW